MNHRSAIRPSGRTAVRSLALPSLALLAALCLVSCGGEQGSVETARNPEPGGRDAAAPRDPLSPPDEVEFPADIAEEVSDAPEAPDPSAVIARVNGEDVTQGEVNRMLASLANQYPQLPPEMLNNLALQQVVGKRALLDYAEEAGVILPATAVEQQIAGIASNLGGADELERRIGDAGKTMDDFRMDVTENLIIDQAIDKIRASLPEPSDEEVQTFYADNEERYGQPEQVRASHILIGFDEGDDEAAKAAKKEKAESLRVQLAEGGDFEALAREHSSCPSSQRGGDLGAFGRGRMVAPFEEAAFALEAGQISQVVETRFGYHVIKVTEHNQAKAPGVAEARPRILRDMQDEALQAFIADLIEDATVERM